MSTRKAAATPTPTTVSEVNLENATVSTAAKSASPTTTTAIISTTTTTAAATTTLESLKISAPEITESTEEKKNVDKERQTGEEEEEEVEAEITTANTVSEQKNKDVEENNGEECKEEAELAKEALLDQVVTHKKEVRTVSETANSESDESASSSLGKLRLNVIRGRKSIKETKDKEELKLRDAKEKETEALPEHKDEKDNKEPKITHIVLKTKTTQSPVKEVSEEKSAKAVESSKPLKEELSNKSDEEQIGKKELVGEAGIAETASNPLPATCRLTRKSAAHELVPTTRVTRNRQTGRPETPPAISAAATAAALRTRRSVTTRKSAATAMVASELTTQTKRKRTLEDSAEPISKFIKSEIKDDTVEMLEEDQVPLDADPELTKIKQEIAESDESMDVCSTTTTTTAAATTTTTTTTTQAIRGRPRGRKSQTPTIVNPTVSPSTRTTRHMKLASQSPSPSPSSSGVASEAKRRRMASISSTVTRSSVSLLKTNHGKQVVNSSQLPDEDSKDSLQSSIDEIPLSGELKVEKFTTDSPDEELDFEVDEKTSSSSRKSTTLLEDKLEVSNGVSEPLTVDTAVLVGGTEESCSATTVEETLTASTSDKAASLSPEMVSEGVSIICVKQFYKKPKFLENNLGIEEDPKLGEIVQKVSTASDEAEAVVTTKHSKNVNTASNEPEDEEYGTLNGAEASHPINDEAGSSNTSYISPLIVEEEELEDVIAEVPTGTELEEECEETEEQAEAEAEAEEEVEDDFDEEEGDCGRLVIHEDDVEDDDDVTVEESETISMENNPSLNDEAAENERNAEEEADDADMVGGFEELELDMQSESETNMDNSKNISQESDDIAAKLEVANEPVMDKKLKSLASKELQEDLKLKKEERKSEIESEVQSLIDNELKKLKEQPEENKENLAAPEEMLVDEETVKIAQPHQSQCIKSEELIILMGSKKEEAEEEQQEKMLIDADKESPATSNNSSPVKQALSSKDDDNTSMKSGQSVSTDTNSWMTLDYEYDEESLRQKEQHLQNLGLLTHKAAEKRRQAVIQSSAAAVEAAAAAEAVTQRNSSKRNGKVAATASVTNTSASEYTGTLKTVIKLNRNTGAAASGAATTSANGSGRKGQAHTGGKEAGNGNVRRQPLKMTFQKGRGRGQGNTDRSDDAQTHGEDAYYTIQNEVSFRKKINNIINEVNYFLK